MSGFLRRAIGPPVTSPDGPPVSAAVVSTALRALPPYCEVVDAHLHDVIDQTAEAATSILGQLATVDSLADVMAGDVARLAGAVGRTAAELSQTTALKDQLMDRLIRYFLDRDEKIRDLVGEMRGLSRHMTQSGTAGQAAKADNDIGSTIADLTTRLDAVLTDDSQLERTDVPIEVRGGASAVAGLLQGVANTQREMSEMVAGVLQETMRAAQQVEQSSTALATETTRAIGHIQFQDISRQMIEHVVTAVADVKRQAEDVIAYAGGDVTGETLLDRMVQIDDLRTRHVMGRQRSTHAESAGADAHAGTEPAVELF